MGAAGGEGEDEVVGRTICEDGGRVPVAAGLSVSGVFWTWEDDGSSGVEIGADDGATTTVEVGSSGVELGAEDGTTTVVVVGSSGVVLGAAGELEETISGVVSTGTLDEAGAEETAGTSSGVKVEDERAGGGEGLPVPDGGWN